MDKKLKFVVENKSGTKSLQAYLVIPNKNNKSYSSSVKINNNVEELFSFAADFAIKNGIVVKKKQSKDENHSKDVIFFDEGDFIIDNFDKELDILDSRLNHIRLKKKVMKGIAIGLSSVFVYTGVPSLIRDLESCKSSDIEILTDNNNDDVVFGAGITKYLDNLTPEVIECLFPNKEPVLPQDNISDNVFAFEYEDRSNGESVSNAKTNMDFFNKYGKMYGIDPNLLMAIMAQESSGIHCPYSENGHAIGGMQIEDVWDKEKLTVFNFETDSYETITVDINRLGDFDYNVKVATMILQYNLMRVDYDIPKAVQAYNMGTNKVLSFGQDWVYERGFSGSGDSKYFEHIFSHLPDGYNISVMKPDKSSVTITLDNVLSDNYDGFKLKS